MTNASSHVFFYLKSHLLISKFSFNVSMAIYQLIQHITHLPPSTINSTLTFNFPEASSSVYKITNDFFTKLHMKDSHEILIQLGAHLLFYYFLFITIKILRDSWP